MRCVKLSTACLVAFLGVAASPIQAPDQTFEVRWRPSTEKIDTSPRIVLPLSPALHTRLVPSRLLLLDEDIRDESGYWVALKGMELAVASAPYMVGCIIDGSNIFRERGIRLISDKFEICLTDRDDNGIFEGAFYYKSVFSSLAANGKIGKIVPVIGGKYRELDPELSQQSPYISINLRFWKKGLTVRTCPDHKRQKLNRCFIEGDYQTFDPSSFPVDVRAYGTEFTLVRADEKSVEVVFHKGFGNFEFSIHEE